MNVTFGQPIPFAEALATAQRRGLLPNTLSSAELSQLEREVLVRSIFSARMDEAEVLDVLQRMVVQIMSNQPVEGEDRFRSIVEAKAQLRESMFRAGVPLAATGTPTIQNFYSDARRQLMVETTVLDTYGFGRHVATQNKEMLWANPALELVRFVVPKGGVRAERPWVQRWLAAMAAIGDAAKHGCTDPIATGRMVALKNHPIWQALGDGAGGHTDGLGNPWAPFAFNSGMNTIEVTREDCEALGIIGPDEEIEPDHSFNLNEGLDAHADEFSDALQSALKGDGLQLLDGVLHSVANSRRARATGILTQLLDDLAINAGFDPSEPRLHGKWVGPGGLGEVFDKALSRQAMGKRALSYQTVSNIHAQRVLKATGLDLRGFRHAASPDDIRHVQKTHGSFLTEFPRGLLPMEREDFHLLPRLVRRAVKVTLAEGRRRVSTLRTVVHFGSHTYVILEDVHPGRHELALKTMVKMMYRPAINAEALSSTSETCRADKRKLSLDRRGVKSLLGAIQEGEAQ